VIYSEEHKIVNSQASMSHNLCGVHVIILEVETEGNQADKKIYWSH